MIDVFNRDESKYVIDEKAAQAMFGELLNFMKVDEYGVQTVNNVFFDTDSFELARASILKPAFKEKLRLRGYGELTPSSTVYIEIKKKFSGVVYKRRVGMKLSEAEAYLYDGVKPIVAEKDSFNFSEIDRFIERYNPKPKVFLAYERVALCPKSPSCDLRITFDRNVRAQTHSLTLGGGSGGTEFAVGKVIMEVKTLNALPLWLSHIMASKRIYPSSFSKYGEYYESHANELNPIIKR